MHRALKSPKVLVSVVDFGRALELADRFNIARGARNDTRVRTVLAQALDFMQPVAAHVLAGHTLEAGSHYGMDMFLDQALGRDIAREQDRTAYLTDDVPLRLSTPMMGALADVRVAFYLSSSQQAATLSLRSYATALDHVSRGNAISVRDRNHQDVPFNNESLRLGVIGSRES